MDQNSSPPRINLQRAACTFAGLGTLLFLAAGTMRWAGGWAFLAEITIGGLITEAWLARHDPGLLAERRTARGQATLAKLVAAAEEVFAELRRASAGGAVALVERLARRWPSSSRWRPSPPTCARG